MLLFLFLLFFFLRFAPVGRSKLGIGRIWVIGLGLCTPCRNSQGEGKKMKSKHLFFFCTSHSVLSLSLSTNIIYNSTIHDSHQAPIPHIATIHFYPTESTRLVTRIVTPFLLSSGPCKLTSTDNKRENFLYPRVRVVNQKHRTILAGLHPLYPKTPVAELQ